MSENEKTTTQAESQKERWLKYGGNVALASVVVVLLAAGVIWLAQWANARVDTTQAGAYSLKPQTKAILKDLKQSIRLVSLYTETQKASSVDVVEDSSEPAVDFRGAVADLLEEYDRNSAKIDAEIIDPLKQPTKVDQLIDDVTKKYGGEIEQYKAAVEEYPKTYDQIKKMADDQATKIKALQLEGKQFDPETYQTLVLTKITVESFPDQLQKIGERVEKRLKLRPPDYKGAVEGIESGMQLLSRLLDEVAKGSRQGSESQDVPADIRAYFAANAPQFEQMKKLADDLLAKVKALGELKLDELRNSLRAKDAILVLGEKDMRVIPREQVWKEVPSRMPGEGKLRPRFAGEQQITSAILSLSSEGKKKVAFVRPGGQPMASSESPFSPGGPLSAFADRLREYNFEVLEKDISGMWAMQAQMRQMPAPPEPTDEQIKDAIWVVIDVPSERSPMGETPQTLAPKLAEHLAGGGSALILTFRDGDPLTAALADWGVKIRTDAIIVHEELPEADNASDVMQNILRAPHLMVVNDYGQHLLAKPIKSLDGILIMSNPVQIEQKTGYTATTLLPIPQTLKVWGETNLTNMRELKYDAGSDIPAPLAAGAVVEKKDGGRLVVVGALYSASNEALDFPDYEARRRNEYVRRFPGNGELLCNAIFWLARMEPMIEVSPAAMETNRVAEVSPGMLYFWRIGLLLVLLPGAVIAGGLWVYMSRRD